MSAAEQARVTSADQPRLVPIHQALIRPVLLAGADRGLVLANGVIAVALVFGIGMSWATLTVAVALLGVGHTVLVLLAKNDPDLRLLYVRHVQHASVYPARPAETRRAPIVRACVPVSE